MTEKELSDFIEHGESGFEEFAIAFGYAWANMAIQIAKELRTRLAQPDADAVAWVNPATLQDLKNGIEGVHLVYEVEMVGSIPLFEYQPEKEWVGLTDEEIYTTQEDQSLFIDDMFDLMGYTKVIEAKLKEKNT